MPVAETPPIVLDLDLHTAQEEVYRCPARFRVAATGRRFGKTTLAVGELLVHAAQHAGDVCWWVAPTYQQSQIAFRMLLNLVPPTVREANRSEREVQLWNGSRIAFKSADNADNLRGEGVGFLVVDEAAYVKEDAWNASLRPTLSDTMGRALLISTFRGENWFYAAYQRGTSEEHPEWASFRFTTTDNPYIPAGEVEEARKTLPSEVFEQEYMANPLVYAGAVFKGDLLQAAIERGANLAREAGYSTYAGLDWGYANETAFEVCQEHPTTGAISWFYERTWTATELNERCMGIAARCKEYDIKVIFADAAGATENRTLVSHLERVGAQAVVKPVPFGKYKDAGIQTRRWYLENGLENLGTPKLAANSKRYRYKEGKEEVEKVEDHTVDAATAFYSSRRQILMMGEKRSA